MVKLVVGKWEVTYQLETCCMEPDENIVELRLAPYIPSVSAMQREVWMTSFRQLRA